jgi:hypothetical protein
VEPDNAIVAGSAAELAPAPLPKTAVTDETTPFDGNGTPANGAANSQTRNRRENFFRREEKPSPASQNGAAPSVWQKIWVKFRELIGFEAP